MIRFASFALALLLPASLAAEPCFDVDPNAAPQTAIAACTDFLLSDQTAPELRADALANRGIALRELGQLDRSAEDLGASVALAPTPSAMRMLAWTYRTMQRYSDAEELYSRVLNQDDHWQGWLSRCVVRLDQEKYAAAVSDCEQALARDPDNLDALFFGARAYGFADAPEKALPLTTRATQIAPDDPRHLVEHIWALHLTGLGTQARQLAYKGLDRFPGEPALLDFLSATQ